MEERTLDDNEITQENFEEMEVMHWPTSGCVAEFSASSYYICRHVAQAGIDIIRR